MQDPKKNYNTKNQVKIGKVNITSFKTGILQKQKEKSMTVIAIMLLKKEKHLGAILDSRIIYADEYLNSDKADAYILKNVKNMIKVRCNLKQDQIRLHR